MHPADIKAALTKKGQPPSKVADRLRVRRSVVSQVIYGHAASRRVALHISRVIGVPVSEIWPGRYPAIELAEIKSARIAA